MSAQWSRDAHFMVVRKQSRAGFYNKTLPPNSLSYETINGLTHS
jgi:hypothetical protein